MITDYPDKALVDNILFNVSENVKQDYLNRVDVQVKPVLHCLLLQLIINSRAIFGVTQSNLCYPP